MVLCGKLFYQILTITRLPSIRIHNKASLKKRRQSLRNKATRAEQILWQKLKGKQVNSRKFRRQSSVGPFILDFYCPSLKLAIEVDGPSHLSQSAKEYDRRREVYICGHGVEFLRFTNQEIYENLEGALQVIWEKTNALKNSTTPSPPA